MTLRAPYQFFGGKSRIAPEVWKRIGDVPNVVEPFFGSGAFLLGRPPSRNTRARVETINDLDGFIPNFWRAIQKDPEEVAKYASWPVSELDLHARHLWLVEEGRERVERLRRDPEWFDAKVAGWWVWGICQWIGDGWCVNSQWKQTPNLVNAGMGVHRPRQKIPHIGDAGKGVHRPSQKIPHIGDAGKGVHRPRQKIPHIGDAGMGVHRPSQQIPHIGDAGKGVHRPSQQIPHLVNAGKGERLVAYFAALSERFQDVRICCGDWTRVVTPAVVFRVGDPTGVFLDPPYDSKEHGIEYAQGSDVSEEVRDWCAENGADSRLRIALCGYAGEGHESLEAVGWRSISWKARGGYGNFGGANDNARRERVWFSPHCLHRRDGELDIGGT